MQQEDKFIQATNLIADANHLLVFTGAGVSHESGIPVFRGKNGLWQKYRPEELATPDAFRKAPRVVWDWYRYRRALIRKANPNPAHIVIAELERIKSTFLLVTQNVDGLHRVAGNKKLVELHGNIFYTKCTACDNCIYEYEGENWSDLPYCECGALMRPAVVWFGEPLPEAALTQAFEFARTADVVLVVGTSGVVYPAAYVPLIVKQHGGKVIEVNIEPSAITTHADIFLQGKAGDVLTHIMKLLTRSK